MLMSVPIRELDEAAMAITKTLSQSKAANLDKWVAEADSGRSIVRRLQASLMMFPVPVHLNGFLKTHLIRKMELVSAVVDVDKVREAIKDMVMFNSLATSSAAYYDITGEYKDTRFTLGSWMAVAEHFRALNIPMEYIVLYLLSPSRPNVFHVQAEDAPLSVRAWFAQIATRLKNLQVIENALVHGLRIADEDKRVFRKQVARIYEVHVQKPVWELHVPYTDLVFAQLIRGYGDGAIPKVPKLEELFIDVLGLKALQLLRRYYEEAGVCTAWEKKPTGYAVISP